MPPQETQQTIHKWCIDTFGEGPVKASLGRVKDELQELMNEIDHPAYNSRRILDEMADCIITMYVVAAKLGEDLHTKIDFKMAINRARKWRVNGDGTGQHIK